VDIAGLTAFTGFLYSFFVTAPVGSASAQAPVSLQLVSELQQAVVIAGMLGAMWSSRGTPWFRTYRRLLLGACVALATLTLSNASTSEGVYRSGFVYDFAWILPFA